MIAYRVNLAGTHDHYLITESQKPTVEQALSGRAAINIGGDVIRPSSIRSITRCEVDLEVCPDYFVKRVLMERERSGSGAPGYRKLPTKWLLLSADKKILRTDVSRKSVAEVSQALLAKGNPAEDKSLRFIAARCHFKFGPDGEKQYFVSLEQIPEALKCVPDTECPESVVVQQITRYGILQG